MLAEIRKDFNISDSQAECRTVIESRWCKGCAVIRFSLPVGSAAVGWTHYEDRLPDVAIS